MRRSRSAKVVVLLAGERVAAVPALERPALLRLGHAVDRDRGAVLEAVVVDGLPEQRDLDDAGVGEFLALVDDVVRRAVDLGPAGERHDAVGAELVAAPGDADVGAPPGVGVGGGDGAGEVEHLERVGGGGERGGPARRRALQGDLVAEVFAAAVTGEGRRRAGSCGCARRCRAGRGVCRVRRGRRGGRRRACGR
jgi:hypothetical protein